MLRLVRMSSLKSTLQKTVSEVTFKSIFIFHLRGRIMKINNLDVWAFHFVSKNNNEALWCRAVMGEIWTCHMCWREMLVACTAEWAMSLSLRLCSTVF